MMIYYELQFFNVSRYSYQPIDFYECLMFAPSLI